MLMFRYRPFLLLLLVAFTSCLTIEERYAFKKDGSGTMTYVVDMSEMGDMMDGLGKMTKEAGGAEEPVMELDDEAEALRVLPGISKVKVGKGKEWVRSVSFRFQDIDALNAALNVLMPDSSGGPHTFFTWEGNTLVRHNNRFASELGASMSGMGEDDDDAADADGGMDLGLLLGSMKYKYSFKFANAITGTTSEEGVQEERKGTREVFWNTDWSVIAKNEKALDLRIDLDR
ncbi:MAG: hypothetical protein R2817_06920 [Flavobacteriales bacterium]